MVIDRRAADAGLPRRAVVCRHHHHVVGDRYRRSRSARRARSACCRCGSRRSRRRSWRCRAACRPTCWPAAAVVPTMRARIDEPRDVVRLRLQVSGVDTAPLALDGAGQSWTPDVLELVDAAPPAAGPGRSRRRRGTSRPEPLIESDDPEIVAEARADGRRRDHAARAAPSGWCARVNGLLEKNPTISLPSAREVLRTKVGDCNEHTALYVAMARAVGMPTRINVGLAYVLRRLLLPRLARGLPRRSATAAGCGCRSIRPSTSFRPTPPTCGCCAAASTGRRRFCR